MIIACLADIHANIYALDAVLADCEKEKVSKTIVAGDLVGYYYWPDLVINRLKDNKNIFCIKGNHENILKKVLANEEETEKYSSKYGSGFEICKKTLSAEQMQWLLTLPEKIELNIGNAHFYICHGSSESINEYIYPNAHSSILERCHAGRDFTIQGHTHYPFIHNYGGRTLINPGSVGQARDIGGHACYALINLVNRSIRLKRIPYNTSAVISRAKTEDPTNNYLHTILSRR